MATFILFLAVLFLGFAFFLDHVGSVAVRGFAWANSVCVAAGIFCESPELAVYVGAGLIGIWALVKTATIMRS
jgi:hypothetical protein